jgi:uncharacterized membrane protein
LEFKEKPNNLSIDRNNEPRKPILKVSNIGTTDSALSQASSLKFYLQDNRSLWYRVSILIALIALIAVLFVSENNYPLSYVRNVLGLIFIVFLPGYALVRAFFPERSTAVESSENLGRTEQVSLSIILSLAIAALMGFALNYSPWGIRLTPIVFTEFTFVLAVATSAVLRDYMTTDRKKKQTLDF